MLNLEKGRPFVDAIRPQSKAHDRGHLLAPKHAAFLRYTMRYERWDQYTITAPSSECTQVTGAISQALEDDGITQIIPRRCANTGVSVLGTLRVCIHTPYGADV